MSAGRTCPGHQQPPRQAPPHAAGQSLSPHTGADQVQGLLQTGPCGPEDLPLSAHVLMERQTGQETRMKERATESGDYEKGDCNGKDPETTLSKKQPEHLKIPRLERKVRGEPQYQAAPTTKPDNQRPQAREHGARAVGPLPPGVHDGSSTPRESHHRAIENCRRKTHPYLRKVPQAEATSSNECNKKPRKNATVDPGF